MDNNNSPQKISVTPINYSGKDYSIDEIRDAIQNPGLPSKLPSGIKAVDPGIQDIRKDVPVAAVYDKLSDGSYIPKFKNYAGATGNEDRLAKQQSGWEQFINGITKNGVKVGSYALDATVGLAYGVYNGISEGSWDAVWDNEVSNYLDDWNTELDNALPNYYTDEQKAQSVLGSMTSVNFWANDFAGALAFVGGAVLPEVAIGALSGGASLGASAAKIGARSAKGVTKLSRAVNKISDFVGFSEGREIVRSGYRATLGKRAGDIASTAGFLARSSGFEAGMEARHNLKEATSNFYRNFQEENGRMPTFEESKNFMNEAVSSANNVFAMNLGVLAVSNSVMFGKALGLKTPTIGKNLKNFGNRFTGLATKTDKITRKTSMAGANKAQKFMGNAYLIGRKPLVEGLYEEGFQGVAGSSMQMYLDSLYDPEANESFSMLDYLPEAFSEQYDISNSEGWKEMVIGMLVGSVGGAVSNPKAALKGQGFDGFGKSSRKSLYKQKEQQVDSINEGLERFRNMNRSSSMRNFMNTKKSGIESMSELTVEDSYINYQFIQSQKPLKTSAQMQADFDAIMDNMQVSEEQQRVLEDAGVTLDEYKDSQKANFSKSLKDFRFAENFANALKLEEVDAGVLSEGDKIDLRDSFAYNVFLGRRAMDSAKEVAEQIEKMTQTDNVMGSLNFFDKLSDENRSKVKELNRKRKEYNELRDQATTLGAQIANMERSDEGEYKNLAEKLTMVNQRTAELEQETSQLENAINAQERVANINFGDLTDDVIESGDIVSALETLDQIDQFKTTLEENGQTVEAESLSYLIKQYKTLTDSHRRMINDARNLYDTDFLNSKEGKGLLSKIRGKKYKMSDEFRKLIKENTETIENSLRKSNIPLTQENVEAEMQKLIEENPNISEREKHRLEAILSMKLGSQSSKVVGGVISETQATFEAVKSTKRSPLEGDTIALANAIEIEDINSIEELDKAIKEITSQIDLSRNRAKDNENQINTLKERKKELQTQLEKTKNAKRTVEDELRTLEYNEDTGLYSTESITVPEEESNTKGRAKEYVRENFQEQEVDQEQVDQITNDIEQIDSEIESLSKPFRIVKTEEYKRYSKLATKNESPEGLTVQEQQEFEELERDIDQWLLITGTVAGGYRLSDLIQHKALLEEAQITDTNQVNIVEKEDTEVTDQYFEERQGNANYRYTQVYDAVMASATNNNKNNVTHVTLHGVNKDGLEEEIGFEIDDQFVSQDEKGNLVITKGVVDQINENSPIKILPDGGTYSVVLKEVESLKEGEGKKLEPLRSAYSSEYSNPKEAHNIEAIYEAQPGDIVELQIDTQDDYNIKLIEEYKKTVENANEETIKEAKDKLKKKLLLRANINGTHVGTPKGYNSGYKTQDDLTFEALRSAIIDNEAQLQEILETKGKINVKVETPDGGVDFPTITVTKSLLGKVNYNYAQTENGLTVRNRNITEQEADLVIDMGYVQDGNTVSREGTEFRETFLNKVKKSPNRTPFIVLKVGAQNVAFPVRMKEMSVEDDSQVLKDIWNSDAMINDKILAMNRFLASRGIDIKEPGNSFSILDKSTHTQEFFEQKLAQVENIDYFYDLDDWTNKSTDKNAILTQQVSVNFDVSSPVHSPKLVLDYGAVELARPDEIFTDEQKYDSSTEHIASQLRNADKQTKDSIEEQKEEDCNN